MLCNSASFIISNCPTRAHRLDQTNHVWRTSWLGKSLLTFKNHLYILQRGSFKVVEVGPRDGLQNEKVL